jgi:hypothetical protein
MKLEQKHLDAVKAEFEVVSKFNHNVLDYSSQYLGGDVDNLVLRYTCNLFDSYDLIPKENIGNEYEELFSNLINKYSILYNF